MNEKETARDPQHEGIFPPVDPRIDQLVGDKLRVYFDSLLDTELPNKIVELISALGRKEEQESERKSPDNKGGTSE